MMRNGAAKTFWFELQTYTRNSYYYRCHKFVVPHVHELTEFLLFQVANCDLGNLYGTGQSTSDSSQEV